MTIMTKMGVETLTAALPGKQLELLTRYSEDLEASIVERKSLKAKQTL